MSTAGAHRFTAPVVLAAALGLLACTTLGPDFEEPSVSWLADWQSDLYAQVGAPEQQTESDLRFWWYLFDDPVLNELIETAKRANPSLQIAGLRILESRRRWASPAATTTRRCNSSAAQPVT